MAEDQTKKASPSSTTAASSSSTTSPQPPPKPASATKGTSLSRRAFLVGAIGASVLLTAASLAQSGGVLGPLIPTAEQPTVIANANDLESKYQAAVSAGTVDTAFNSSSTDYSQFFYWPYDISVSPYYKNIVVRLPDDKYLTGNPTSEQYLGQTYSSSPATASNGAKFVAFNTTCVHLRCLVNPGYASGQFRLQCPCHGSQYNLADGVPVAGPARDLGLSPLPKIQLSIDSTGNITATSLMGVPGVGRTTQ